MRGIRSSDGDVAPSPSHTTGRAVFRIRRLNPAAIVTPQDPMVRGSRSASAPRCSGPFAHCPCGPCAKHPASCGRPSASGLSTQAVVARAPGPPRCASAARNTSVCAAGSIPPAGLWARVLRPAGSIPTSPGIYPPQSSRSWLLLRLWLPRHISRTFALNRSTLSAATPIRFPRSSRNPRNLRSQTLPEPLLAAFTFNRRCFSIQPCTDSSTRSAAA